MDPNISARPMKPKIRMVRAEAVGCKGCDMLGKLVVKCHEKFMCIPANGPLLHVKIVGEVPSTR